MKVRFIRNFSAILLVCGSFFLLFQNCAPAKLSSSGAATSSSLGTQVNLASLLNAPAENSANVLYPSGSTVTARSYQSNAPVIENVVVATNDFTTIEWVYAPTQAVVSVGESLNLSQNFSAATAGTYYVFGFRGSNPYLIAEFQLSAALSGAPSVSVTAAGALQVNSTLISSSPQAQNYLITVSAPSVNFRSIQFSYSGQSITANRAILVSVPLTQNLTVSIALEDLLNSSTSSSVFFSAQVMPTPTPASTPSATPTPVPTATPASFVITAGPSVSNITTNSTTIGWSISAVGTGQIQYGLTTSYGSLSAKESSFNYSTHSQTISGLSAGTTYHFRVVSVNQVGTQVTSSDATFTTASLVPTPTPVPTPAPTPTPASFVITAGPSVSNITTNSATITWSISAVGTGVIQYGLSKSYGLLSNKENSFNYSTHIQTISGLSAGTTYHFRVVSVNQAGTQVTSSDATFTTTAPVPTPTPSLGPDICSASQLNFATNNTCPQGQVIIDVVYASYGDAPAGSCGNYQDGACTNSNAMSVVQAVCMGQSTCSLLATDGTFGGNSCNNSVLTIDVVCGSP